MLQFFRNNNFFTSFLVILYFTFFSINIWLYPNDNLLKLEAFPSTLSNLFFNLFIDTPFKNKLWYSIFLLLQAFLINGIISYFKLTKRQTYITAICFIMIHFSYHDIDLTTPVLIANTLLLWSIFNLFASSDNRISLGKVFNVGFSIGIAALLYNGNAVFIVWALFSLYIIRAFNPQEYILLIFGFCLPFYFIGTYHFLNNNLELWIQQEILVHYNNMNTQFHVDNQLYLLIGIMISIYFLALVNMQNIYYKTTARKKKNITAIYLMPAIGLFSFFVQKDLNSYHFISFFVPLGILLSLSLQSLRSNALIEGIHFILFILCFGIQFQSLIYN